MHIARFTRPLAVAGISAIAILTAAAGATPSASASTTLYTAPPVIGTSPASCLTTYCFLDDGNWAGYQNTTISTTSVTFLHVQASFSVPSVNCTKTATGYASQAAALGGKNNTSGLEAAGVTSQCVSGTASYEAWWETYPDPQTAEFSVNPGDAIAATVTYDNTAGTHDGQYELTLTDQTSGQSFSVWESCAATTCLNTAAEVGSAAPSDASSGTNGSILALADYGAANFVGASVTESSGTVVGLTSSTSTLANQLSQVSATTNDFLASPGTIYGGEAFSDTWKNAS